MFDGLDDAYPLSPLQQGMLYESLKQPDSDIYVAYIIIDIQGQANPDVLKAAWQATAMQHETLRTRFLWEELDEPLQLVNSELELNWHSCSSALDATGGLLSGDELVEHWLQLERSTPLSLSDSPPIRFRFIDLPDHRQVLIWTVHHLLADDWSTPTVLHSVAAHYAAIQQHGNYSVSEAKLSYGTYINWLSSSDETRHLQWWKQNLAGVSPTPLTLEPVCKAGMPPANNQHIRHRHTLAHGASAAVKNLSQQTGGTLSSIMHAAWAVVLARYTGTGSVLFGTSVSGRSCELAHITEAVGLFLNTLPTAIRLINEETTAEFINRVQQQLFAQIAHEHVPLSDLSKLIEKDTQSAAFDTVLVVEAHGADLQITAPGTSLAFSNIRYITDSNFPLTVLVFPGEQLELELVASEHFFSSEDLQAICEEFAAVIADFCSDSGRRLADITHRQELRMQGHYVEMQLTTPIDDQTIDQRILQAVSNPRLHTAVIDEGHKFSYHQLYTQADGICAQLLEQTTDSDFVGVFLQRGFHQIAAIVGILMSGKAYVPLDCDWPQIRIRKIIDDAAISVIVSDTALAHRLGACACTVVAVEPIGDEHAAGNKAFDLATAKTSHKLDAAAYMIYTSGSTGEPKGVAVSHRNLSYSTSARIQQYKGEPSRYLLLSPYTFDSSIAGIFWTLCSGGTLVLPGASQALDIHQLQDQIKQHAVTHTLCLPSLFGLLLRYGDASSLQSLQCVIVAGEASTPSLLQQHRRVLPNTHLYNEYGPTEATVWATAAQLTRPGVVPGGHAVPIGHAIPGTRARVVNATGQSCPTGVAGELHISGPGVSNGYHGDVQLTQSRFSGDTFSTGDQAVLGPDRQLYFLGRIDRQIKVRGYRIEPGEIESRLLTQRQVREAYCCSIATNGNETGALQAQQLVCYYTLDDDTIATDMPCVLLDRGIHAATCDAIETAARARLESELPAQFAVARFMAVNCMPTLSNGKVDSRAFPVPGSMDNAKSLDAIDLAKPETPAAHDNTEKLCEVLAELLGGEIVRPSDNFFSIGGDSLTAIRFVALSRERGVPITIPMVTSHATLQDLGVAVDEKNRSDSTASEVAHYGPTPLAPVQHWFMSLCQPNPDHWNMAFTVQFEIATLAAEVQRAVLSTLRQFPVLACRFVTSENEYDVTAHIDEAPDFSDAVRIVSQQAGNLADSLLEAQQTFNIESGKLCVCLIEQDAEGLCQRVGMVVHHLVTDAVSNWHIAHTITESLLSRGARPSASLGAPSYRHWAIALNDKFSPQADNNRRVVNECSDTACRTSWFEEDVVEHSLLVDNDALLKLTKAARGKAIELPALILQLIVQALQRDHTVRVDVETHGRVVSGMELDASGNVGWHTGFFKLELNPVEAYDYAEFSRLFTTGRDSGIEYFLRTPCSFFDMKTTDVSSIALPAIVYNFLLMSPSVEAESSESRGMKFSMSQLTDNQLRNPKSKRSHGIEIVVTDADNGMGILWRTDKQIARDMNVGAWIDRASAAIKQLSIDVLLADEHVVTEEFPDSGLSDAELDKLLSDLD